MDADLLRTVELYIGISGAGKTSLMRPRLLNHDRVFVLDDEERAEYNLGAVFTDFDAMAAYVEGRDRFTAIWRGEDPEDIEDVFGLAFAVGGDGKGACVAIEEADRYTMPTKEQEIARILSGLPRSTYRRGVLRGKNPWRLTVMASSQWPGGINPEVRKNATDIYAFTTVDESALRWLKPTFGAAVYELPTMPFMRGLHWHVGRGVQPFEVSRA